MPAAISKFGFVLSLLCLCIVYLFGDYPSLPQSNQISPGDRLFISNFTSVRRDLNRVRPDVLKRFFRLTGFQEGTADHFIQYRKEKNAMLGYGELVSSGLMPAEADFLTNYFYLEPLRKSTLDDLISDDDDPDSILSRSDWLSDLLLFPMNLNTVSPRYLAELPGMDADQARKISNYRKNRDILTLMELTNAGIEENKLLRIAPYVTVRPSGDEGFSLKLKTGLSQSADTNGNLLPPFYTYRADASMSDFRASVGTASATNWLQDASGSEILRKMSGFVEWNPFAFRLIGGDYRLQFGQGLLFGSAFTPPVGDIDSEPIFKTDRGLKGYSGVSSSEDRPMFFRGGAASWEDNTISIGNWNVSPRAAAFYSKQDTNTGVSNRTDYGFNLAEDLPIGNIRTGSTFSIRDDSTPGKSGRTGGFYYNGQPADWLKIYGETASAQGLAAEQGLILKPGRWSLSMLGYYAETNFTAPSGAEIIHSDRDITGFFAGTAYRFDWAKFQFYGDWYSKSTNSLWKQKYEGRSDFHLRFNDPGLKELSLKAQSRYSDLIDDRNLRNEIATSAYFAGTWSVGIGWQNLMDFPYHETGNSLAVRFSGKPWKEFEWVYSYMKYSAPSYKSALFSPEVPAQFGDMSILSYYGVGNEDVLVLRAAFSEDFHLSFKIREDYRSINGGAVKSKKEYSGFLEWKL